jgi:hypothetical protein
LMAIVSSGVSVTALAGLRSHLLTNMRLACFSGLGSRKGALAVSLPLRRGTRQRAPDVRRVDAVVCVGGSPVAAAEGS